MVSIYVLKCRQGKYYVGKTNNTSYRISDHFDGDGSSWTKRYTPISVDKIYKNCSNFDEDKYTKEYMSKYGIENVRGGSYTSIKLDDIEVGQIEKEITSSNDKCFRCGRAGHFASQCYARTHVNDSHSSKSDYEWCCEGCNKSFKTKKGAERHVENCIMVLESDSDSDSDDEVICYNCGKPGHYATNCYSRNSYSRNRYN